MKNNGENYLFGIRRLKMMFSKEHEEVKKIKKKDRIKTLNEWTLEIQRLRNEVNSDENLSKPINEQIDCLVSLNKLIYKENILRKDILDAMSISPDLSDKFYLKEIIDQEKPTWGMKNLIISPVRSGKTTMIREMILNDELSNILVLFTSEKKKNAFLARYLKSKNSKINFMTYNELSLANENYMKENKVNKVFCDEINWLYSNVKKEKRLKKVCNILFQDEDKVQMFYFTASQKRFIPGDISLNVFDYSNYKNIRCYVPHSKKNIYEKDGYLEDIQGFKEGAEFYNLKGLSFGNSIEKLKEIEKTILKEGYKPLVLLEENNLNDKQTEALNYLIETGEIPDEYDFLIINTELEKGKLVIEDERIRLVIFQVSEETDYIEGLGTLDIDIDLIVYRTYN